MVNRRVIPRGALIGVLFVVLAGIDSRARADLPRWLFGAPQLVPGVNSPDDDDRAPSLTADELEIFFYRGDLFTDVPGPQGVHLYGATRASRDQPFGEPRFLSEINSDGYFTASPEISPDGLTLYFMRQVSQGPGTPYGRFTVWSATRSSRTEPFGEPVEIIGFDDLPNPNRNGTLDPSVTEDGLALYVTVTDDVSGVGDIYVATRATLQDEWSRPVPVAPFDHTSLWHSGPAVTPDGRSLFHVQDPAPQPRSSSLWDISVSVRETAANAWSGSINLGSTINTLEHEAGPFFSRDGSALYFSRSPDSPAGELWRAPVIEFDTIQLHGRDGGYSQNFDSLGVDASVINTPLPSGWSFTANDVAFTTATSLPLDRRANFAALANGGSPESTDRAPVTEILRNQEYGELDLRVSVTEAPVQWIQLAFDLEVWRVYVAGASAAFQVVIEADSGSGFHRVADLGVPASLTALVRPATGSAVDGNDPAYRTSFDSGPVSVNVPVGSVLRARWIGTNDSRNSRFGIDNVSLQFLAVPEPSAFVVAIFIVLGYTGRRLVVRRSHAPSSCWSSAL